MDKGHDPVASIISGIVDGLIDPLEFAKLSNGAVKRRDHFEFVQYARIYIMVFSNRQAAEALRNAIEKEANAKYSGKLNFEEIQDNLVERQSTRRFKKLVEAQAEAFDGLPPLITGASFDECLKQYQALVRHVEQQWREAALLYRRGNYHLAVFVSVLVVEEIAKLGSLWNDLLSYDTPRDVISGIKSKWGKKHKNKHFMGITAGGLINARLDRILGRKRVSQLLNDAESSRIEELRQRCLYIERGKEGPIIPSTQITMATARDYTVLSGELMAEVLGKFPWEFDRLVRRLTRYEIQIGYDSDLVQR